MHQSQLLNDLYNYHPNSSQCPNNNSSQAQQQPFTSSNNIYQPALISHPQQNGRQLFQSHNLINQQQQHHHQKSASNNNRNNNNNNINDMSLYSPSSSTSLLYHVYDQINLPNEHSNYQHLQQQQHHQLQPVITKANNTTVLNPANLFGTSNVVQQQQQQQQRQQQQQQQNTIQNNPNQFQLPLAMQLHQSKQSQDGLLHNYSSLSQYQSSQPTFNSNTLHHNQASIGQQQQTNGTPNPLIDAYMVHNSSSSSGSANTNSNQLNNSARPLIPLLNQTRPLSSSGGSSTLSAHSMHLQNQQQHQLTYGRHLRQAKTISSKSSSNLASVLQQSSNTLSHLTGFDATGRVVTTINPSGIKPHLFANNIIDQHHNHHLGLHNSNQWRLKKSAKHYLIQYQAPIKFIALLLLLSLSLLTIVRYFTSSSSSPAAATATNQVVIPSGNLFAIRDNYNYNNQLVPQAPLPTTQHHHHQIPQTIQIQPSQSSNNIYGNNPYETIDTSSKQMNPPMNQFPLFPNQASWPAQQAQQPVIPMTISTTSTSTSTTTTTTPSTVAYEQHPPQQQAHLQTAAKCLRCEQNGGRCNSDGRCQCPPGFYGPLCKPLPVSSLSMDAKCQRLNGSLSEDCGQPIERQCDDKIDNDNDGLVDCADSDCCSDKACQDSSLCMKSPDPRDILMRKPPMPPTSSFFQRMQFLIEKSSSQYHSSLKDFNDSRASVIRGRVMYMKKGVTGVRVSVAGNTQLGMTLSRQGGYFDLMVNGGGAVLIEFRREPFATHQRAIRAPWNEIVLIDPVELALENSTSASIQQVASVTTTTAANTFDQEQAACFAHNYQLMKPQIVASPKSSSSLNGKSPKQQPALSSTLKQVSRAPQSSIARTMIHKESGLVQEIISLPGGQFTPISSQSQQQDTSSNQNNQNVALVYVSSKANEFMSTINLQLVPASSDSFKLPDELKQIHLKIVLEGNLFEQLFEPTYNLNFTYAWNRRNVYTQKCYGVSSALVSVGYEYFDCQHVIWSSRQIQLPGYDLSISDIGQHWNLNIHHRYNYRDSILQLGDGQNYNLKAEKPKVVVPLIGDSYQRQTSCPYCDGATSPADQRLLKPQALVSSPDGALYVGDHNLIRRVESQAQANANSNSNSQNQQHQQAEKLVKTILEFPPNRTPTKYSLALNSADSSKLYLASQDQNQIFAIRENVITSKQPDLVVDALQSPQAQAMSMNGTSSLDEQLVPIVGTGERCVQDDSASCGDGHLARLARLVEPRALTFDLSGRMYIADGRNVRMVDVDSRIYTLLGDYSSQASQSGGFLFPCSGEAIPSHKFTPKKPLDLAINPIDDSLYMLDSNVVYRLTQDKRIQLIAGRPSHCALNAAHLRHMLEDSVAASAGDSFVAADATGVHLQGAQSIAFNSNGDLYISEEDQERGIARVLVMSPSDLDGTAAARLRLFAGLPAPSDSKSEPATFDSLYASWLSVKQQQQSNAVANMQESAQNKRSSNYLSATASASQQHQRATEYKFNSISAMCVDQQGKLVLADRVQLRLVSIEPDLPQMNANGEFELQSPENADEILVFNRYGHHVATKEFGATSISSLASQNSGGQGAATPSYKFSFTYSVNSPFGQLASVLYASGNKISIYREGPQHVAKMIETTFGGQLKLEQSSRQQVNAIAVTQPNATKINLAYQNADGGLLKQSHEHASGETYDIQYDEFGRATSIHYAAPKSALVVDCRLAANKQAESQPQQQHMAPMLIHPKVHMSSQKVASQQHQLCASLIVQD